MTAAAAALLTSGFIQVLSCPGCDCNNLYAARMSICIQPSLNSGEVDRRSGQQQQQRAVRPMQGEAAQREQKATQPQTTTTLSNARAARGGQWRQQPLR